LVLITFFRNCKVLVNSERSIELTYTKVLVQLVLSMKWLQSIPMFCQL